jgi:tetratricopeptide (TPR) repeat protein
LSWLGDPAAARVEADRAVRQAPLSARSFLTRARVELRAGLIADALRDVEEARRLEPDDPRVWTLRGEVRAASGDGLAGLADLDRAIALGGDGDVHAARAEVFSSLRRNREALNEWNKVLARDPSDPFAYLGRAEAFLMLELPELALADLEQAAGWADGRPGLGPRLVWDYARALARRPNQSGRLAALIHNLRGEQTTGAAIKPSS